MQIIPKALESFPLKHAKNDTIATKMRTKITTLHIMPLVFTVILVSKAKLQIRYGNPILKIKFEYFNHEQMQCRGVFKKSLIYQGCPCHGCFSTRNFENRLEAPAIFTFQYYRKKLWVLNKILLTLSTHNIKILNSEGHFNAKVHMYY